jgi:hypothetical protein
MEGRGQQGKGQKGRGGQGRGYLPPPFNRTVPAPLVKRYSTITEIIITFERYKIKSGQALNADRKL